MRINISTSKPMNMEDLIKSSLLKKTPKVLRYLSIPFLLKKFKANRTAYLLKTTDFTLSQIAYIVGFKDEKQLGDCFMEVNGISPHLYRHQHNDSRLN